MGVKQTPESWAAFEDAVLFWHYGKTRAELEAWVAEQFDNEDDRA